MTVTATSTMANALASAIALLSASSTFQTRTGSADAAAAAAHIYTFELQQNATTHPRESLDNRRAFAVVDLADNFNWDPIAAGCSAIKLQTSGSIIVVLTDNAQFTDIHGPDPDDGFNDSMLDFLNFCGGVMDDMSGKFNDGISDTFGFQSISMVMQPTRTAADMRDATGDGAAEDCWEVIFAFSREGAAGG
jgi:hypothetical protein